MSITPHGGNVALRRPVQGELGAMLMEQHVTRMRCLLDQLDAMEAVRHTHKLGELFGAERAHLRDAVSFMEHIRRNGYEAAAL